VWLDEQLQSSNIYLVLLMEYDENTPQLENIDNTEIDELLQRLVLFVDWSSTDYGLTVQVGSSFISGRLISKKEYLKQNFNTFQGINKSVNSGSLEALQNIFEDLGKKEEEWIAIALKGDLANESDLKRKPSTLHLKNAKIYETSLTKSPFEIPLIRVKLSSVDSFFISELVPS